MNFQEWNDKINEQEKRVRAETDKLLEMHREHAPRKIKDYTLNTAGGPKTLSSFFAGKNEMILIHNMGKKCPYCTLWGDGLIGFTEHLQDRAALLMVNGDDVPTQTEFARGRGWKFLMASTLGTTLFEDFGARGKNGDNPGVSILTRDEDGQMWQKTIAPFGPGDIFCAQWSFVGMLPGNVDWAPKYKY